MNISIKLIYGLIIGLFIITLSLSIFVFFLIEERDYYKRTSYDPERFALLAPNIKAIIKDMGELLDAERTYISLFHNGTNWLTDGLHPPFVHEVFVWNPNFNVNNTNILLSENIKIDSIPKIYELLEGNCVSVPVGTGFDLKCPLVNQDDAIIGYYGAVFSDLSEDRVRRAFTTMLLYSTRLSTSMYPPASITN